MHTSIFRKQSASLCIEKASSSVTKQKSNKLKLEDRSKHLTYNFYSIQVVERGSGHLSHSKHSQVKNISPPIFIIGEGSLLPPIQEVNRTKCPSQVKVIKHQARCTSPIRIPALPPPDLAPAHQWFTPSSPRRSSLIRQFFRHPAS